MNESMIDSFLRCTPPLKWVAWSQNPNLDDATRQALHSILFDEADQLRPFAEEVRRGFARCLWLNRSLRLLVEHEISAFMESIATAVEDLESDRRTRTENEVRELHFIVAHKAIRRKVRDLSGYIHDARLNVADSRIECDWARIPLQRDCWEYGFNRSDGSKEFYVANSLLSIYPAASLRLIAKCKFKTEPWISRATLQLGKDSVSTARFSCIGNCPERWSLVVNIADRSRLAVLLADQERPYLWSKRYNSRKRRTDNSRKPELSK